MKVRKATSEDSKYDVNMAEDSFENVIGRLIDREKNPALRIRTGLKLFNDMMGGGFEPGRLYVTLGLAKGWKSGMLLNMALHAKKYNTGIQTKDPNKTPVILFVTQENTINETLLRIWSYLYGNDSKIHHYDHNTAMNMLNSSGLLSAKAGEAEIIFKADASSISRPF